MHDAEFEKTRNFWNSVASDWRIQVGKDGDKNRQLNSDPVLWQFAGEVRDRTVLDAGCGTGYLSQQLTQRGARVIGVDFSERMIDIARSDYPALDFRVESCSELRTIADASIDLVVSNYVLMDTPDLPGTLRAWHRVLRPGGTAVLIFSHPCFPGRRARDRLQGTAVSYYWDFSYFETRECVDPPWGHFTESFIWFHRPLSEYWKAFSSAGFSVLEFEEPHITPDRYHLAETPRRLRNSRTRPYSVAFKLLEADGKPRAQ
ncbi:class I SAM-dependent methyltransferase [soil metagenome]